MKYRFMNLKAQTSLGLVDTTRIRSKASVFIRVSQSQFVFVRALMRSGKLVPIISARRVW